MLKNVKKNDEVVTAAGIHGTVVLVKDKTVVVRVDDNVKIEFDKESITKIISAKS
jgi:preprotein translocase subunit YajC